MTIRKTSQLQVRVTPKEKRQIAALAKGSDLSVSEWVLTKVLPTKSSRFAELVSELVQSNDHAIFAEVSDYLSSLPSAKFQHELVLEIPSKLSHLAANQLAAMVEYAAEQKKVEPPTWVKSVEPLAEPHFASSLSSLRLHLLTASPAAFKRRNLYVDSAVGARV